MNKTGAIAELEQRVTEVFDSANYEVTMSLPEAFAQEPVPLEEFDDSKLGEYNDRDPAFNKAEMMAMNTNGFGYDVEFNLTQRQEQLLDIIAADYAYEITGGSPGAYERVKAQGLARIKALKLKYMSEKVLESHADITDLVDEIRVNVRDKGLEPFFFYKKEGEEFKVYSRCDMKGVAFERVIGRQDAPEYLKQDGNTLPYVVGETLKEAVERAVEVYKAA